MAVVAMGSIPAPPSTETAGSAAALQSLERAQASAHEIARDSSDQTVLLLAQVAALIAHEVNNLLTPASARCEMLVPNLANDPDSLRLLGHVQAAVAQACVTSRTILEVASGPQRGEKTSINSCVRFVVDALLPPTARPRVRMELSDQQFDAAISHSALAHITLNLLLNALAATAHSGEVVLSAGQATRSTRNDSVSIIVRDTGLGMTPAQLHVCYRTFDPSQSGFYGKSLGTLLCRLLVERAGGSIRVDSAAGRGTTVTVLLPAAA